MKDNKPNKCLTVKQCLKALSLQNSVLQKKLLLFFEEKNSLQKTLYESILFWKKSSFAMVYAQNSSRSHDDILKLKIQEFKSEPGALTRRSVSMTILRALPMNGGNMILGQWLVLLNLNVCCGDSLCVAASARVVGHMIVEGSDCL